MQERKAAVALPHHRRVQSLVPPEAEEVEGDRGGWRVEESLRLSGTCLGAREILKFLRDTKVEYMGTATTGHCEESGGSVGLRRELGKIM